MSHKVLAFAAWISHRQATRQNGIQSSSIFARNVVMLVVVKTLFRKQEAGHDNDRFKYCNVMHNKFTISTQFTSCPLHDWMHYWQRMPFPSGSAVAPQIGTFLQTHAQTVLVWASAWGPDCGRYCWTFRTFATTSILYLDTGTIFFSNLVTHCNPQKHPTQSLRSRGFACAGVWFAAGIRKYGAKSVEFEVRF